MGNAWNTPNIRAGLWVRNVSLLATSKSDRENLDLELTSNTFCNFKFVGKVENDDEVNADIILNGRQYKISGTWSRGK